MAKCAATSTGKLHFMHDIFALGKYAGLIFTKLDLPQPPSVDLQKLLQWMNAAHRKLLQAQIADFNKVFPDKQYPWRPVWAHDGTAWDAEFAEQFPELVAYVKLFPATDWRRVILLAQLPDEEVFLHVDPDLGIGWRAYLTLGGPQLYFRKFKDWTPLAENAFTGTPTAKIQARVEDSKIYVPAPSTPYPWALTSVCAAHGVEKNIGTLEARIALLIMPKHESVDVAAHHDLLSRSTTKYASDAIWY